MSRIGKKPIVLPAGVTVSVDNGRLEVKGPKGEIGRVIVAGTGVSHEAGAVVVTRADETSQVRANHGLMRALLANMVSGVSTGFVRGLEIHGVGYKAEVKGKTLVLNLGYSHQVVYPFPNGITIDVEQNTKLKVKGVDKELVGQVSSELRNLRPPDSYKGKGVRYTGERIRIKAGKSAQK